MAKSRHGVGTEDRAHPRSTSRYQRVKSVLDFCTAGVLLVLLAPTLAVIAVAIRLDSSGPALYCQRRVGARGKPFTIWKFRTMKVGTAYLSTAEMQQQGHVPVTRVGKVLRRTSLDELPQLLNIIRGEMSFIGPRPALLSQTDVNALRAKLGADVAPPGIGGLAQAMGRDDLDVETKVGYDAEYCRRMSLLFDLRIAFWTLLALVSARGMK